MSEAESVRRTKKPTFNYNEDSDSDDFAPVQTAGLDDSLTPTGRTGKKVTLDAASTGAQAASQVYQKLNSLEHVLKRPDMYIGSLHPQEATTWVWNTIEQHMERRKVSISPGLVKIFDEILINAADNFIRGREKKSSTPMTQLKVVIDKEKGMISVWNNGPGIPVEQHQKEKKPIPELIFGDLRAGENFHDGQIKLWGGMNGYGAKLTNIFSTKFIVECSDGRYLFKQTFTNNLSKRSDPSIHEDTKGSPFTKVTFYPDTGRFGENPGEFSDDIVAVLTKRVYDIAGSISEVKVTLNGKLLPIKNFQVYVGLYKSYLEKTSPNPTKIVYCKVNDRWEVAVHLSDQFQQISFVNNLYTEKGGTHVDKVTSQLCKALSAELAKKNKGGIKLKSNFLKNTMAVYVNCFVNNPSFNSQSKDYLSSPPSTWGSHCKLPEDFLKQVLAPSVGIVDAALRFSKFKEKDLMGKNLRGTKKARISGIAKLDDANKAGSAEGYKCTLILTEGDSAKSLATAGISVVGRDFYGVFPLRGKILNVRDAKHDQIMNNEEIKTILKIVGLTVGKTYDSVNQLRYGRLMIMTDQDYDGSHIKGLLINLIDYFWPSLLKINGFLEEFITPIVVAKKGNVRESFFTIPEYEAWRKERDTKGWDIKYYKGLATTEPEDAKNYFRNITKHRIKFIYQDQEDRTRIDLAFNKNKADDRKTWISNFEPGTFLDQNEAAAGVTYTDFVDKELILFSMDDCNRSIPCLVDGLKPSQRKVLFGCIKRNLKKDIRVAQLAGYVGEHTAYHHGEASLHGAITGLAQNFVGSNNVNLLFPSGMFGTRILGGKDAGAARYIFTRLAPLARKIFRPEDDPLLTYVIDDGQSVEPVWYIPILPMVLLNGADGIGTGWSTKVPQFNPRDIVENLRRLMNGQEPKEMTPWYRGFKGTIEVLEEKKRRKRKADQDEAPSAAEEAKPKQKWICKGTYEQIDDTTYRVTELPVGAWTEPFKAAIEALCTKDPPVIKDYQDHHTDTTVDFDITFVNATTPTQFESYFKLQVPLNATNMHLFDEKGRMRKYETPLEILEEFYRIRLDFYNKRKEYMLDQLARQLEELENKVRFILAVINKEIVISNRKRTEIEETLSKMKFKTWDELYPPKPKAAGMGEIEESEDGEDDDGDDQKEGKAKKHGKSSFDYLLRMALWSLSHEKVEKLKAEKDKKEAELTELMNTKVQTLWDCDLDEMLAEFDTFEAELDGRATKAAAGARKTGKAGVRKVKRGDDSDSEEEFATKKRAPTKPKAKVEPKRSLEAAKALRFSGFDLLTPQVVPSKKPKASTSTLKLVASSSDGDGEALSLSTKKGPLDALVSSTKKLFPKAEAKPGAKRPSKKASLDSDSFFDSSESAGGSASEAESKKKGAKKATSAPTAKPKAKPIRTELPPAKKQKQRKDDSSSLGDIFAGHKKIVLDSSSPPPVTKPKLRLSESDDEVEAKKPAAAKAKARPKARAALKKPAVDISSSQSDASNDKPSKPSKALRLSDSEDSKEKKPKQAAAKPKAKPKSQALELSSSLASDLDSGNEEIQFKSKPAAKAKAPAKAKAARPKATKKAKKSESSSLSASPSISFSSSADDSIPTPKPRLPSARSRVASKRSYKESSDGEEEQPSSSSLDSEDASL